MVFGWGDECRRNARSRTLIVLGVVAAVLLPAPVLAARSGPPSEWGLDRAATVSGKALPAGPTSGRVRAGAAVVDASWHVGASAGQYATDGTSVGPHGVDPNLHSTRRNSSYGIQSRTDVRALVVEGADGKRVAVVTNDLYIPQDLVNRRAGAILEDRDRRIALGLEQGHRTGITDSNMAVSVSHSHSTPYYSTPSWGVWAFQDVFDIRFFEYVAQRIAAAVVQASHPDTMRRVRMGGAEVPFDGAQRHSYGPQVADDGTPSGYPQTDNDKVVAVIRFDDVESGPEPQPLATWVVFGLHPEMLSGNDLLTGEYTRTMMRFVDREVGGVTLFSQNNVGSSEPARNADAHPPEARAEFSHREYAQMERAARLVADAVEVAHASVATGVAGAGGRVVQFAEEFPVGVSDVRIAPPGARAGPSVSNCRAEKIFDANPPIPVAGLPDCEEPLKGVLPAPPFDPGVVYDDLRKAGVPVPDNIPAYSYTGLQETVQVHLQAFRFGDIGVTVCPCEQFADQSRNIKSRLLRDATSLWIGFDWTTQQTPAGRAWCVDNGDTTWTCANPQTRGTTDLEPVSDHTFQRMLAQIRNPACDERGCWDDLLNALQAETDPWEPGDIWGNYRHEDARSHGYGMVVPVSMTNDYWGYIVPYREFQAKDHYRKALTGLGPHSSDFLATRLTRLAAGLNGGARYRPTLKDVLYSGEDTHQRERARWIGELAAQYLPLYAATLPADGGAPAVVAQPSDIERFDAARMTWVGGSNWFDLPDVRVERLVDGGAWERFADMSGEVQALVRYPQPGPDVAAWRAGQFAWRWEATFEAFASDIVVTDATGTQRRATPPGTYRFVVDGTRHAGLGETDAYHLESAPFAVAPWSGIQVTDLTADPGSGTVTFRVAGAGPPRAQGALDYPDSYASPFRFIQNQRSTVVGQEYCFRCSFRPWADAGEVATAEVEVAGSPVTASCAGQVCTASASLGAGDVVAVTARAVQDEFGNRNGQRAEVVVP